MTEPSTEEIVKRKRAMLIALACFVLIGISYLCYWGFYSRFYEFTDDAYVDGNMVYLTPQVSGIVTYLTADNSDFVPKGRVLVELDRTDAEISLNTSVAQLGLAVREVCGMFEQVRDLAEQISGRKAILTRAVQDFEHRQALIEEGAVSTEDWEHAIAELKTAFAQLMSTEHQFIAAVAQVENTTIQTHPKVAAATERVKQAYVDLQRCTLRSPVTGIVAQRSAQVGKQIVKGEPLMAVVPLDQMWATANYKEIQLSRMRVGQPVNITVDMWGSDVIFHGKVVGVGGGTGSIFSVLPPQNATGNWIKIVQRLPVKIALDPEELLNHPLRLGLSLECQTDIRDTKRPMIPAVPPEKPLFETDILSTQEKGADQLIEETIKANLSPMFVQDMLSLEE